MSALEYPVLLGGEALVEGPCHICGQHTKLSWEHVPPRSAGNIFPVRTILFEESLNLPLDAPLPKGKLQRRGMGAYTLCESCNSRTGHWYSTHFARWCFQGWGILELASFRPSLVYLHHILPLPVIKQVAVMFFSANPAGFQAANPELVEFVLNPERRFLPPKYRFWAYYNHRGVLRFSSIVATLALGHGVNSVFSEITFPPFGYVLTFGSPPPHPELCEITHFARYGINEYRPMQLRMPVLPTFLSLPGDYREMEQIRSDWLENHRAAERIKAEQAGQQIA